MCCEQAPIGKCVRLGDPSALLTPSAAMREQSSGVNNTHLVGHERVYQIDG